MILKEYFGRGNPRNLPQLLRFEKGDMELFQETENLRKRVQKIYMLARPRRNSEGGERSSERGGEEILRRAGKGKKQGKLGGGKGTNPRRKLFSKQKETLRKESYRGITAGKVPGERKGGGPTNPPD